MTRTSFKPTVNMSQSQRRGGQKEAEDRSDVRSRLRETTSQKTEQSMAQRAEATPKRGARTQEPWPGSPVQNIPAPAMVMSSKQAAVEPKARLEMKRKEREQTARDKDTLVKNGIMYLTFTTGNKIPVRRTDFLQRIFGKEKREAELVNNVIRKVQRTMENVFGYYVWGYNEGSAELSLDIQQVGYSCWFVISKHKGITKLINKVKRRTEEDRTREAKQALLVVFLTLIFMQNLDYGIEESQLWNAVTSLELDAELDIAERDFKKFMKTEYVVPMYLKIQEEKNEEQGVSIIRYIWGPRSHLEISKWSLFKHAVRQFPGKKPQDFAGPLQFILNSEEARIARTELLEWEKHAKDSDSSADEDDGTVATSASDAEAEVSTESGTAMDAEVEAEPPNNGNHGNRNWNERRGAGAIGNDSD